MRSDELHCPVCSYVFDPTENMQGLITYWAEDGPKEVDCPRCEIELVVTESVTRTYDVQVAAAATEPE